MSTEATFNFIINSLKVAGAPYNIINNELIMAQCQVEVPRTFFTPARIDTMNLQIICQPELLAKYPGSELVSKGSYRLQWFVEGIKKRGLVFKGYFPYELDSRKIEREINSFLTEQRPSFFYKHPFLLYQPHLLVNFKVSLETDEKFDELHSLSINLVNGEISSNLLLEIQDQKYSTHIPPKKHLEERKIPYSEGFEALYNHLKWIVQNRDSAWIKNAQERWEEEVRYLEDYYQGENDGNLDDQGFYRQVAEIYRKYRPVIKIFIVNVGLLLLPTIVYTIEPWGSGQELTPIIYHPIQKKIKWNLK